MNTVASLISFNILKTKYKLPSKEISSSAQYRLQADAASNQNKPSTHYSTGLLS